jgi:hypothetical protein
MEYYAKWFRLPLTQHTTQNGKFRGWTSAAHLRLCDKFDNTIDEETYIPSEPTNPISTLYCQTEEAANEKLNESVVPHIIKKWNKQYGITKDKIKKY